MVFPGYARPSGPDPVNPQDLATKNYVDTKSSYALRAYRAAGYSTSVTPGTQTIVAFESVSLNQGNCYNTGTGLYTCPVAGIYMAHSGVGFNLTGSVNASATTAIYKNGVEARRVSHSNMGGYAEEQAILIDACIVGDTFSVYVSCSIASLAVRTSSLEFYFQVFRLGP